MNPKENPIQLSSSDPHPSEEPKKEGFRIRVENPDLLLAAIQEGRSGTLGKLVNKSPDNQSPDKPEPLDTLEMNLMVDRRNSSFDLEGKFALDTNFANEFSKGKAVGQAVAEKFAEQFDNNTVNRGGAYILTVPHETHETRFVLDQSHRVTDYFNINTGMPKHDELRTLPPPQTDRESLSTVIEDFTAVLESVVRIVYNLDGKIPPNQELILHPPQQATDKA